MSGPVAFRVFTEPQQGASYDDLLAVARTAEDAGYDAFFRSDHYLAMGDRDGLPGPTDAWVTLAGLARETTRLRLGTLVTAATFLVSAAFLLGLPEGPTATEVDGEGPQGVLREALAGFAHVGSDGRLRVIIGIYAASALTWGALSVIVVVLALDDLGLGDAGPGYLLGAISIGGLIGGAVAALLAGARRLAGSLGVGTLLWGLPLVAIAAVLEPWMALAALALIGVGEAVLEVATMTLLQRAVPDEVRARVFGVLESLTVGAIAIGGAIAAPMLAALGTRGALLVIGMSLPGLALALLPRLRAIDREAQVPEAELALLRGIPLFAALPPPVLEGLAGRLRPLVLAAGQEVVRQGEPGERFYVVERGSVRVSQDGRTLRTLGPGDFFGEIALLRATPRTATCTTAEATSLRTLERDEFVAAVTGHAPSREAAEAIVDARLTFRAPGGVA